MSAITIGSCSRSQATVCPLSASHGRLATRVRPANYQQAIEAVQEWYAKHGQLPKRQEWQRGARGRPTARTIDQRWGWDKLMAKASGRRPAQLRLAELRERRRRLLRKLRTARDELGRWPGSREWAKSTVEHASSRTYARNFGSWEGARRAATRADRRENLMGERRQ